MSTQSPMIGEIITLGRYPYEISGAVRPIEWQIMQVEAERMLVLARQPLAARPYAMTQEPTCWENSDLRRWLNEEFLREAFTEAELERILGAAELPEAGTDAFLWQMFGMYTTTESIQERVFIPMAQDLAQWYPQEEASSLFYCDAEAEATPWAQEQGATEGCWWLRESMQQAPMAYICSPCASVGFSMISETNLQGVRPAMWLRR